VQDNKDNTQKNKPVPENERPDWAKSVPEDEWNSYVHSPQCRVCNAEHNGRKLRVEIEGLAIDRKSNVDVCDVIFERYGLQLAPHNIRRHMIRHAPGYANALKRIMQSELGDVLNGAVGPIVGHTEFLVGVIQVAWGQLITHPEQVTVTDGIRAAGKLIEITKGLDILQRGEGVSPEDITTVLDIMQFLMTAEQRAEVERRFLDLKAYRQLRLESFEGEVPEDVDVDDSRWVVVDGEFIDLESMPTMPQEDATGMMKQDHNPRKRTLGAGAHISS